MADAHSLMATLPTEGIREVVLCPRSRSASLVEALVDTTDTGCLRPCVVLDERSAGFIALGTARAHILNGRGRYAAVTATSGTAVSNPCPAINEVDAVGILLLAISANRPHELIDTGASQTAEQTGPFVSVSCPGVDLPVDLAADFGGHAVDAAIAGQVRRVVAITTGTLSRDPGSIQISAHLRPPLTVENSAKSSVGDTVEDTVSAALVPSLPFTAMAARAAVLAGALKIDVGQSIGPDSLA